MIEKIERIVLIVVGCLLTVYVGLATSWASFSWGCRLLLLCAVCMIILGIFIKFIKKKINWLRILFYICLGMLVSFMAFLAIYSNVNNVTYDEDYCVILGAKVNGYNPSVQLKYRLDSALEYYEKNTGATFIVCGGQGSDEVTSEASVMADYLISNGVPSNQIIIEDKSTSTLENFKYALELLGDNFSETTRFVCITNDFHIFRAGLIAKEAGIDTNNLTHFKADSPPFFRLSDYSREFLATAKFFVLGG